MSLADYLAKNYLTADAPKKSKKRKRKTPTDTLTIADDTATGWEASASTQTADDDNNSPLTLSHRSAEFRKAKASNWTTLSGAPVELPSHSDDAAADAILLRAEADNSARSAQTGNDEAPAVANPEEEAAVEYTASGARAGLTTAAQFAADMARKRLLETGGTSSHKGTTDTAGTKEVEGGAGTNQETIYRDASGRIINISMQRASARAASAARAAASSQAQLAAKGDVQAAQRAQRKEELEGARTLGVARHADDKELNEELRAEQRWDDPAAGFVRKKKAGKSVTGRPLYVGAVPPNRYGIRPGHRWDGVDRGRGFEAEWFKARNRRDRLETLDYAWQMDE